MTRGPAPPAEAGLSAQRTWLAWRRTSLSGAIVALLAARPAMGGHGDTGLVLAAATAMGGWAAMVALAYRRGRGLAARPPRPGRRALLACAGLTVAAAAIGVALVLT